MDGITRKSVIELLKDWDQNIVEKNISIDELIQWHNTGDLLEMFVSGTAATLTNIEMFSYKGIRYDLNTNIDLLSVKIKEEFNAIRIGAKADRFNWMIALK